MITDVTIKDRILKLFSFLKKDEVLADDFFKTASYVQLTQGTTVCEEGDECSQLALIVDGSVRVFKMAENGKEITLYRISAGESCILTASCILSHSVFPATASLESNVQGIVIPAKRVHAWMDHYSVWRGFIFDLVAQRLSDVISVVDQVAFGHLQERIIRLLMNKMNRQSIVKITHQDIADELGTSREVISRLLKEMESQQWLRLSRGTIEILNLPVM